MKLEKDFGVWDHVTRPPIPTWVRVYTRANLWVEVPVDRWDNTQEYGQLDLEKGSYHLSDSEDGWLVPTHEVNTSQT